MQVNSYLFQSPYSQSVQVGRPDPVQEQKQAAQEAAKAKAEQTDKQSSQVNDNNQVAISVKSSTMYQNDSSSKNTIQAVNAFIDVAKDARRSENIDAYSSNKETI